MARPWNVNKNPRVGISIRAIKREDKGAKTGEDVRKREGVCVCGGGGGVSKYER